MKSRFMSLLSLESLRPQEVELLHKLDIRTIGDLLGYQPMRYARYIRAAKDGLLRKDEVERYLDARARGVVLDKILARPVEDLRAVGRESADVLQRLGVDTIGDLAAFAPYDEAESTVSNAVSDEDDPFAPPCVLPNCKKFTRNKKRYASFFKQDEIRHLSVVSKGGTLISNLFRFYSTQPHVIYLGYSVSYLQEWIYCGVHLGEPRGSVNLFMGQDSQVSVLDWRRAMSARRREDTRVTERLAQTLFHQRAVDEVARATAEEHQYGGTSAFGANAATAGSFVAAGAIVGGIGGGVTGALSGLAVDALLLGTDAGLGTISGAVVGTAVGSAAGAAAGSLIFSGATTLGFVETDAEGDREIFARSAQNIQQQTIQNSSSIRSFWSDIISQSVEDEQQEIRTNRVTNHNRIHALNALYFEVLNEYKVNITANSFSPIIFIPFKPVSFDVNVLRRYWWLLRTILQDKDLVTAIDEHFLTLTSAPSPSDELAELTEIDDIETSEVVVEVNLDGSQMESLIAGLLTSAFIGFLPALLAAFYDAFKRDQVKVSLITSEGTRSLSRISSPNSDPNFVGRYRTTSRVPIHNIEAVKITNDNAEFTLGVEGVVSIDLNELVFEDISARLSIRNKSDFSSAVPGLGALENEVTIRSSALKVAANSSKNISWDVADRLRDLFEGIEGERETLTEEAEVQESIEARISNLLGFLNANKYAFTRFILEGTEREQLIRVLEEVEVGGVDLSRIAGTTPVGFCGNHVVLPLKRCEALEAHHEPIRFDISKFLFDLDRFDSISSVAHDAYFKAVENLLKDVENHLNAWPGENDLNAREREFIGLVKDLQQRLGQYLGVAQRAARLAGAHGALADAHADAVSRAAQSFAAPIEGAIRAIRSFLREPLESNESDIDHLCGFYASVSDTLTPRMGRLISSDDISLPSPAVFMEPVLSHAKGAELYDMRRNSHWEVLPSPGIGSTDPNVLRGRNINLTPTVPGSTLSQAASPDFGAFSLGQAALAQAGKLDLSTLLNTNASTLNSTLSGLTTMATELAKASAQLTGSAQEQVLASATDVAKQISGIIGSALQIPEQAPPAPLPDPPSGQQQKAEVVRRAKEIDNGSGSDGQKRERKKAIGAPVEAPKTRDYRASIVFLDESHLPYPEGEFTMSMTLPGVDQPHYFNGGHPIPILDGRGGFNDVLTLEKGRLATIQVNATIGSVDIPGFTDFTLPDKKDLLFKCRMQSETRRVSATNVQEAVNNVVSSSSESGGINAMLNLFLNAGVEFPFRVAEVALDGGGKIEITDLRYAYENASSSSSSSSSGSSVTTEYEVVIPKLGWDITIA